MEADTRATENLSPCSESRGELNSRVQTELADFALPEGQQVRTSGKHSRNLQAPLYNLSFFSSKVLHRIQNF